MVVTHQADFKTRVNGQAIKFTITMYVTKGPGSKRPSCQGVPDPVVCCPVLTGYLIGRSHSSLAFPYLFLLSSRSTMHAMAPHRIAFLYLRLAIPRVRGLHAPTCPHAHMPLPGCCRWSVSQPIWLPRPPLSWETETLMTRSLVCSDIGSSQPTTASAQRRRKDKEAEENREGREGREGGLGSETELLFIATVASFKS